MRNECCARGYKQSKLLYTGQERDNYTNYDYMHFRYYSSSIGRFLKPDNIIGNLYNPQSWNLYSYVRGNPINYNDPTGHAEYIANISMGMVYTMNLSAYMGFYSNLYGGNVSLRSSAGGSTGMAWVTTTYTSVLNKYNEGSLQASFNISYSASYILDLTNGLVVSGSWIYTAGSVNISEGANNPGFAHYLASPENIATMENCAETILSYAQSSFEAAVFLNIGWKETYLGVLSRDNPLQLTGQNGYERNNLIGNVQRAEDIFRGNFVRTGNLLQSLIDYNGSTEIVDSKERKYWYGSDVYRGYLEFMENMRESSVYELWRLGW